jgi:diguanylate cyclase (GGDEF)-like protein/PAS domain S-box-containing protein
MEGGKAVKLLGAMHDITEQKQAERTEQFRSHILELLARGEALPKLLDALLSGVEALRPNQRCSILQLDSDGRHLCKGVAPSLPDFYNAALDGIEIGVGVGSCGTAAFTGERVIVEDISTHPYWAPYKDLAASAGLGACWSQPILSSTGRVLGTFAIYHQEPHTPQAPDLLLIEQCARLASIAIERSVAAEQLQRSEAHYRLLTEDASDVVWRQDADNRFTYISPSDERMRGFRADEVVGRHVFDLLTAEGIALVASRLQARMADEARGVYTQPEAFELQQRCRDGSLIWTEVVTKIDRDAQGTLLGFHGISRDITRRKAAEEQIRSLAFYDPLTELPNRRLLMDRLEKAISSCIRSQRKGALLFVDLDNFKTLNDTLGHDKGDLLLQQVAQRLSSCVRDCDTVARLGGDEFVVMLEDLSESPSEAATQAEVLGAKILSSLNQNYRLASYEHHSTPSIGITLFGEAHEGIDEPLKRADLAMYQAKAAGRNTLRFFDPQMQDVVTARAALEDGLREALAGHQFVLHYQAQVDNAGRASGAEALVRWMHPERGMVSPAEFIPLAEETSLILPLGSWVMETACTQLALWSTQAAAAHLTVSVNVSARQFHQNDFVAQVSSVLERTGANPRRLKLELTEGLLVSNIEDVIAKMTTLKALGVGFSLDDFGTGYSSLSYLKRLPLDQLKIDQGFVRDILIDPNDAAIAKMVIVLADSLGLSCIAEGVETQAQLDFLASQGCQAYQGYLFSRPLPVAAFEAFLSTSP